MDPVSRALTPLRWQISRAMSAVTRSSADFPMNFNVCWIFCSGTTFRKGDCCRSTINAFFRVPSNTESPVVLAKSVTRI